MECNIFDLLIYFIIYSILGWVLESLYRSFCEKRFINTGFLHGPFCPIYGIGAIIMFLFLEHFKERILILFLISFFILSIWEYVVGILLEKIFKTRYWDYSDHKINIKGRVCLFNSICWGILGVIFVNYIHPYVVENIETFNSYILNIIIYIITIIFLIDTVSSVIKTKNIKTALERVEELNSQIKEKLDEIKRLNSKNLKTDIIENMQYKIDILKRQKNRLFRKLYRRVYRLKKAFPDMQNNEITEILNRKLELIKKEKGKKRSKNDTRDLYNR